MIDIGRLASLARATICVFAQISEFGMIEITCLHSVIVESYNTVISGVIVRLIYLDVHRKVVFWKSCLLEKR